jgi:hypothetical protein
MFALTFLKKSWDKTLVTSKLPLVSISVFEFSHLALVPTGNRREVPGDPGDAVHVPAAAICTLIPQSATDLAACLAAREFGRKCDLVVFCVLERLDDKIGQRRRGRS